MIEIIPAIIPQNLVDLTQKLELVKGLVDTVQIDFCDGRFVPTKTWPFTEKGKTGKTGEMGGDVDCEAHLMVKEPAPLIPDLVKMGFMRVLLHAESFEKGETGERGSGAGNEALAELIHEWQGAVEIGVALLIETPLAAVDSFAHELKSIQLMGIAHIGRQGQPFDARVVPRAREARKKYPHLTIAVDGGVSLENAHALLNAGASRLVVGSSIFAADNPRAMIEQFKQLG